MRRLSFAIILFLLFYFFSPLAQEIGHQYVRASPDIVFADANDGYVDSGGIVYVDYFQMSLGDWNTNAFAACFVKFNLSGISGTLSSATLKLFVYESIQDNNTHLVDPLANIGLGDCQAIHIDDYGTLDFSDLSATSIGNDPGVLIGNSTTPNIGYVSIDVRAAMQDDINNARAWSAYMLTMSAKTDNDNYNDYWVFRTSEYGDSAERPIIEYGLEPGPSVYEGDLVLTGNNVTVITGRFDINGSIIVTENATLILQGAIVNLTSVSDGIFLQDPAGGNPRLQADNATISGNNDNRIYDNSSVILTNCSTDDYWYFDENTDGTIFNTTVGGLQARANSTVAITNSTISHLDLVMENANASVHDLSPGFFFAWDLWSECSIIPAANARVPHFTLTISTIDSWSLSFQGQCVSEIARSEILRLHLNMIGPVSVQDSIFGTIEPYSNPIIELTNSTYSTLYFHGDAQVYSYWYLQVKVTDSIQNNVNLANVTIAFPNSTICTSELTDINGTVKFTLMEKILNTTGYYRVENYTVTANYETYNASSTVNLTESQQITLKLKELLIPEFPSFLVLALFMVATLLAVKATRRKLVPHV